MTSVSFWTSAKLLILLGCAPSLGGPALALKYGQEGL